MADLLDFLRKMTIFAHGELLDFGEQNSQESVIMTSTESFANFLMKDNPLIIKELRIYYGHKIRHLSMKKHGICEKSKNETDKSHEIKAFGLKETSSYAQPTSSKSYKQDCCRSLSFG